jgi:hypothetical protein
VNPPSGEPNESPSPVEWEHREHLPRPPLWEWCNETQRDAERDLVHRCMLPWGHPGPHECGMVLTQGWMFCRSRW